MNAPDPHAARTYPNDPQRVCLFRFTAAPWGPFSNFWTSPGFVIRVADIDFSNSEALYQALKHGEHPEVQRAIAHAPTPRDAKRIARATPCDIAWWNRVRIRAMRYTLRMKCAAAPQRFREELARSAGRPIVEYSTRDPFWGATPRNAGTEVHGTNVLGRLWMEIYHEWIEEDALRPAQRFVQGLRLNGNPLAP